MVFVTLAVLCIIVLAVLHRFGIYSGNFWEHLEWACFGVVFGVAFMTIAPDDQQAKNDFVFLLVFGAAFGHLCMGGISSIIMRVISYKHHHESEQTTDI